MTAHDVDVPGAFWTFWSGTGVAQGDPWSDVPAEQEAAEELRRALAGAPRVKRGRGFTIPLRGLSPFALAVLGDYADACLTANSDEPDASEVRAARLVADRVGTILVSLGWRRTFYAWMPPDEPSPGEDSVCYSSVS